MFINICVFAVLLAYEFRFGNWSFCFGVSYLIAFLICLIKCHEDFDILRGYML